MPDGGESVTLRAHSEIADIPAAVWDACAGSGRPFLSHAFLSALEDSGSATPKTGWQPQHLSVTDGTGAVLGVAPLYLKSHSHGEYVFDWGWADAYERAGGRYYPKLQVSVPFTPVAGPRFLIRPDANYDAVFTALLSGMLTLAKRSGVSSLHITFPTGDEWRRLGDAGFLQRIGHQYIWENRGYQTFDDFLATLTARKRKAIRKERRTVADSGLVLRALQGGDIQTRHWDAFDMCYRATADTKWGHPYLTRDFFHRIGACMAERIVLVIAEDGGTPVAGALNFLGDDAIYGRNWGCIGDTPFLHFEACYYQAIDFAIAHGLARVEAGAQGEHKIQRGYLPKETYSAHWIADPGFEDAVRNFLVRESAAMRHEIPALAGLGPYRHSGADNR
jgi:predicted N-acyltransferase